MEIGDRKIVDDVMAFLGRASSDYGKIEEMNFSQWMFCDLLEGKISSPIEQLFYIAFHLQCKARHEDLNPNFVLGRDGALKRGHGIYITPQFYVGKYRVDFLIERSPAKINQSSVIVELDGHQFHDKDKKQRAYEKARDRALVKAGYRVLHFTGSEVVADPYKVAHEALVLLGMHDELSDAYDAKNPLGIE